MAIEIRLLRDDEHPLVVNFFNNARSIDHKDQKDWRTLERFEWEFVNSPHGKAVYIVAIETDNDSNTKIVGTQCAIPFIMNSSKGEEILTAKGEDTLIDIIFFKKYRNRDILKEMYNLLFSECTKRGIKLIWGFTNIPSTFKRIGFDSPFLAKNAVMTIKPLSSYKYLSSLNQHNTAKDKFKIFVLSILSSFFGCKRVFVPKCSKKYNYSDRTKENTELFYNVVSDNKTYYSLNQDDKFIKWRLIENPSEITYKTKQFFDENNNLISEIIYSYCKGIAYIEQTMFSNKLRDKTKLSFIKKIIEELVSEKSIIIRFAGFENNPICKLEIQLLKKAGFIFAKNGAAFVIKSLTGEDIIKSNDILLSRLYFQGFRQ